MSKGLDQITDAFPTLAGDDGLDDEPTSPLIPHVVSGGRSVLRSPPRLERIEGDQGPELLELARHPVVFGRSSGCEVVLDSASLSRKHVRVEWQEHDTVLTDLDSRNGVYLNGVRVHSAILRDRDTIQVGPVVYLFRDDG